MKRLGMLMTVLAFAMPLGARAAETGAPQAAKAIAQAYGLDNWGKIESIRFTFNVKRGTTTVARQWSWDVGTDDVSLTDAALGHVQYNRHAPLVRATLDADQEFVNDSFWLLFPFHLVWDTGTTLAERTEGGLHVLNVAYPAEGGYTPGDTYDAYYGPDHVIRKWTYHKGGAPKPTMTTTWEETVPVGPLMLSLKHRDPASGVTIWFSDVAVKTKGQSDWQSATPQSKESGK